MSRHAVPVAAGPRSYDILIGENLLDELGDLLDAACPASRYAVITDETVGGLYGERVRDAVDRYRPCDVVMFPPGEWNKTREQWSALTDALLHLGLGRDGAILALGGGVAGDLAGFVAATYLRGIPYVQLPTTLLAMIDSSIGGKTGVDTGHGKNLVGAFHQPRLVVADVTTAATLPPVHVNAGLAEALKHGAIADAEYFGALRAERAALQARDPAALVAAVRRSVEIKAAVVEADERETGRRAILNFGHTIAHALEAASGYELLHGEAVAIGMVLEAELGRRLGVTAADAAEAVATAVREFSLPDSLPTDRVDDLIEVMSRDKKRRSGPVRFALLERLGQPARTNTEDWTIEVPASHIREVLDA